MDVQLPLARYRIELRADSPIRFSDYSGSAWRGLFGHALKRTVCVTRAPHCTGCLLYRSCVYSYVFETPPPPATERLRGAIAAPHPFVLSPDPGLRALSPGEVTHLDLTLIGRAQQHLPYMVHALSEAGKTGIGRDDGRFEITRIAQEAELGSDQWHPIFDGKTLAPLPPSNASQPPAPQATALRLLTPMRLKYADRLMTPERFESIGLISNLLRRLSLLSHFHADRPFEYDYAAMQTHARALNVAAPALEWYDWTRYSNRQRTTMQMGGLLGRVELGGAALEALWPLLWFGQWIHAGKATSMGLGRYALEPASLPEAQEHAA
ncbi:MAG: CRISPR system precrRNA processing endoribonuclease RAMP protein Cas6 [Thiotrichales bacterium]